MTRNILLYSGTALSAHIYLVVFCFRHENISGFYRVSSFFLAKLFCDLLPNRSVPILAFGIISYWMIGESV